MSAEGKESERDRGVKGKYLFTFSQRPGVCEMQFALKKKNPEVGNPDPKGRAGESSGAWVWLSGSGRLVPSTDKGQEGLEGLRRGRWSHGCSAVRKGEADRTGALCLCCSQRDWGNSKHSGQRVSDLDVSGAKVLKDTSSRALMRLGAQGAQASSRRAAAIALQLITDCQAGTPTPCC